MAAAVHALAAETDRFFLWIPVCFGVGIGIYFGLNQEPPAVLAFSTVVAALGLAVLARPRPLAGAAAIGLLLAALGFADAKLRSILVDAPVVTRATGVVTVEGWVERAEPRQPRGHRVTLRVHRIAGLPAGRAPHRVRITALKATTVPPAGAAVAVRAVLRPVPEPVRPGGFDFARKAWFARLGGVGFAVGDFEAAAQGVRAPASLTFWAWIDGVRSAVARRINDVLTGEAGAIAVALITGERGGISQPTLAAMRHSGLAHVLAISGLHMAMMAGALYWLARAAMAAVPALALRYPIKKWAAEAAMLGGVFYLALSGAGIATQRAFLMITIFFLAILLDRPALTLRNVAIAATALLVAFPESLLDVSFQMSFAAVTALVAVYEAVTRRAPSSHPRAPAARVLTSAFRYMGGIALTTIVASLAVAPFAAFHFHKLAQFGLLANLAAMPLFGLLIMPMALAALLALPFGLEAAPLHAMAQGLDALVAVAETVSGWEGAVVHVVAMPTASLVLLAFGGLWLALWRSRWRSAGLVLAAAGLAIATGPPRPDLLIDRDGKAFAVRTDRGVLEKLATKGARYSLEKWWLADGQGEGTDAAPAADPASRCDALACIAMVQGKTIAIVKHPAALDEECRKADIVVSQIPVRGRCPKARVVVDRFDLWAEGAHALYLEGQSIRTETVASWRGERPWVRKRQRRRKTSPPGRAVARELPDPEVAKPGAEP
ncbi:MAG: ComEC/Rec2 family competence protein [Methyloligellaceae bacterium]